MPYPTTATIATIINSVKTWFLRYPEFSARAVPSAIYYEFINYALDEIYQDCYPQPDEFSVTTVVGQCSYPIDGTSGNFPMEIGEIMRVDYNGTPLERYLLVEEVIPPDATDSNDTPTGYYERVDGGVRYLELTCPPDEAITLKVYANRLPVVITDTTEKPALERDFWNLLVDMLIARFYEWMDDEKRADRFYALHVNPAKRRLKIASFKRFGRHPKQMRTYGAFDVLD